MKSHFTFLTAFVLLLGSVRATSYFEPENYKVYSPNGLYFVSVNTINSQSTIQSVFATSDPTVPLWTFSQGIQFDKIFIANDGMTAIYVAWRYVSKRYLRFPAVTIYRQNGQKLSYPYRTLSKPRKYRKRESGPIGEFWRVWLERTWQTDNGIMIVTPPRNTRKELNISTLSITKG
jgi:hypothetical protein